MSLPVQGPAMGMAMRFGVVIDGMDLGGWQSCKGLHVSFENEEVAVGGEYEHTMLLPTRLKYNPITLVRAMDPQSSATVRRWLRQVLHDWYENEDPGDYRGSTAQITLADVRSEYANPVSRWSLRHVYPKSWKGPDLDASSHSVALESLELVHQGFL